MENEDDDDDDDCHDDDEEEEEEDFITHFLWPALAAAHQSARVIRRGEIPPDSPIRTSNYHLLWPLPIRCHEGGVPEENTRPSFGTSLSLFSYIYIYIYIYIYSHAPTIF